MIQNGSEVTIHYTLTVDDQTVESSAGGEPLSYVQGQGQIIPGLEEQMEGLAEGEKKEITVGPDRAYGMEDPRAFQKIPRNAFQTPDELKVGDRVSGKMGERTFQARVTEVSPEEITLNLNHPLAGKTLHFAVQVVAVR